MLINVKATDFGLSIFYFIMLQLDRSFGLADLENTKSGAQDLKGKSSR